MRIAGRVTCGTGAERSVFVGHGEPTLAHDQRVVITDAASDPVAEEREAVRTAMEQAYRLGNSAGYPKLWSAWFTADPRWYAGWADGLIAEGDTELAAALALRASLEPEEDPLSGVDAQAMADSLIAAAAKGEPSAVRVMLDVQAVVRKPWEEAARQKPDDEGEQQQATAQMTDAELVLVVADGGYDFEWGVNERAGLLSYTLREDGRFLGCFEGDTLRYVYEKAVEFIWEETAE